MNDDVKHLVVDDSLEDAKRILNTPEYSIVHMGGVPIKYVEHLDDDSVICFLPVQPSTRPLT